MRARSSRGFTLFEIVLLIAVVAAALVGVLLVFQSTVASSADAQVRKQALAIAEALLEEVLLASYDPLPGTGARADFDDIQDYHGYTTVAGGMRDIENNLVPGLGSYNATVAVAAATPLNDTSGTQPVNAARRVTVTVTVAGLSDFTVRLDGWRVNYTPP